MCCAVYEARALPWSPSTTAGIAFSEADRLFDELRVPPQNRSYYQSGRSGMNFGLRFFGGYFGEHLPGNQ